MQNKPPFYMLQCRSGIMQTVLMICIFQALFSYSSFSQDSLDYETARERLVKILKKRPIDKIYTESIDQFYFTTCDSLIKENLVIEDKPIKDILVRLFIVCEDKVKTRAITSLRIPAVNNYFLLTIQAYQKEPINRLYREIGFTQTAILQSTFDGLLLGDSIKTFVGLREMLNFPYYISARIGLSRYSRYKDTLLYYLANTGPDILVDKLTYGDSLITTIVNKSNNRTVKAVSQMKANKYFDAILPFSFSIFENRVTVDEIVEFVQCPQDYYHAFVDEAIRLHNNPDPEISSYLKQPIATINKDIAYSYFVYEINKLHSSPDKIRFQVINTLSAEELYFLIIGGSNLLYTSSFLYIYKKLLKETEKEGLNKFFDDIGYYQFDQFVSSISIYGLVNDLVAHLREERFAGLLKNYLAKLQNTQLKDNEIILNAMTMSEVLYDVKHFPKVKAMLIAELENLERSSVECDILLQRMYGGFKDILLDKNEYNSDKTYDVLSIDHLKKNDAIVQVWFFYDDDDAVISFASGTAIFDKKTWNKTDFGNYIVFTSSIGNKMMVFMNKPNTVIGSNAAQEDMLLAIKQQGYEPTSFIHRGHSYHVFQSFSMMTASAEFVFLGSCGGTNEVLRVFQLNPDVHVIVTRHVGSKLINDQLLARINWYIVNNRDIKWDVLWKEFNSMFKSKLTKDLFSSYIPPNKYIGVKFIRKVFNY